MTYLIADAHQDLAWNMLSFGRDYSISAHETRQKENGGLPVEQNGDSTLGWPDFQRGRVALVFSTIFAAPTRAKMGDWDKLCYATFDEAYQQYNRQLDAYEQLFDRHPDKFSPIRTARQLASLVETWNQAEGLHPQGRPTGLVTLMEGADCIRSLDELDYWWERGVRILGPAWMGTRYCGGTREPGPLTHEGHALLDAMADHGFTLDLSHMDWAAALEALDEYEGNIIATHANPLTMVKGSSSNRFLTDEILDGIIARGGVIGVVPFNRFIKHGWKNSDPRSDVPLDMIASFIDYICQRAGSARHAGFGTDFDGGFGFQHIPDGMDTIADLQKIAPLLAERGYSEEDIVLIFGGNWIEHLKKALPA